MVQRLADNIDQLDLALDQLAVGDRNFDRFAIMLVDNIVELELHRYIKCEASKNGELLCIYGRSAEIYEIIHNTTASDKYTEYLHRLSDKQRIIEQGLKQTFDNKLKAACKLGLVNATMCETILNLHSYRNSAYHKGLRHEGILHSLAIFYFRNACELLKLDIQRGWSWGSHTSVSYRAMKYIGNPGAHNNIPTLSDEAYSRLDATAASLPENLIGDLSNDLLETINSVDESIDFLANGGPIKANRDDIIIDAQSWVFAHTEDAKKFACSNGYEEKEHGDFINWVTQNYDWPVKSDPIPAWRKRYETLTREKDKHKALKRYCDFMRQTEDLRDQINESAVILDNYIQQQIDMMRGK